MQPDRRRLLILAVLVAILAGALYRVWPRSAAPAPATSNARGAARTGQAAEVKAPDVKLEALEAERPKPEGTMRNLFQFGRGPAPPVEPPAAAGPKELPPPTTTPGPTGPTPIPLKFVGTMQVGGKMMAVLSDASGQQRSPVY